METAITIKGMTEEQITAIAREYAEEIIDPCGFSKGTYEELVDEKAEECRLKPSRNVVVKVSDDAQVNDNTEFID